MTNQMPQAIHVWMDNWLIKNRQAKKDKIGSTGNSGTLKPPDGISLFFLKNRIPIETIIKASKVPIFTSSASLFKGISPAQKATATPKIHVLKTGV